MPFVTLGIVLINYAKQNMSFVTLQLFLILQNTKTKTNREQGSYQNIKKKMEQGTFGFK